MATSFDGILSRPIGFFPTRTAPANFLKEVCDSVDGLMTEAHIVMAAISGDCLSTNMTVFKQYAEFKRILCIPDYAHVFKNIRNHFIGEHKLFDSAGVEISTKVVWDNEDQYFPELSQLVIDPRDKQSVRVLFLFDEVLQKLHSRISFRQVEIALKLICDDNIEALQQINTPESCALALFMYHAGRFYNAFDVKRIVPDAKNPTMPVLSLDERAEMFTEARDYFKTVNNPCWHMHGTVDDIDFVDTP